MALRHCFIDIYAHLDDDERRVYQQRHAPESAIMSQFAERFEAKGRQEGEARILLHKLTLKFSPPSEVIRLRVQQADSETLPRWSARVLTAQGLDEVFAGSSR